MNDLDDWLNLLGIDPTPSTQETTAPVPIQPASIQPVTISQLPQEEPPTSSSMSLNDFNDILTENGFQEPAYDEAEEVTDEDENLDAGEHENWDNFESQGVIQEYTQDVVPPDNQEILHAVQSVNDEDYPEHNTDEEQVSEDALEAFNTAIETVASPAPEPLIPPNSPTLLLNDATSRFSGTEWYNEIQKQRIILAGCGGIGSWTILQLARMNPAALFMYDDDVVEQANMSGQLYCQDDIGKAKVDAMADMIKSYTTMRNIYAIKDKFTQNSEAGDVMICGFDNMAARNTFFHAWRKHLRDKSEEEKRKCLYLDGRLSIDTLQVFCITGDSDWAISEYMEKYLFTDAQAEETQCSLKQTTYLACMIGSMIVNLFTNFVANTLNPIIPYDLPFFTEYDAQNMIFKTIK